MNRRLLQETIGGSAVQNHKTDCGIGHNIAEPVCVQSVSSNKDRQHRAKEKPISTLGALPVPGKDTQLYDGDGRDGRQARQILDKHRQEKIHKLAKKRLSRKNSLFRNETSC